MDRWTPTDEHLPKSWELVLALDANQNYFLVEWDDESRVLVT